VLNEKTKGALSRDEKLRKKSKGIKARESGGSNELNHLGEVKKLFNSISISFKACPLFHLDSSHGAKQTSASQAAKELEKKEKTE